MASGLTMFSRSPTDVENQGLYAVTGRSMPMLISIPSNFMTLLKYRLSIRGHAAQPRRLPGQGKTHWMEQRRGLMPDESLRAPDARLDTSFTLPSARESYYLGFWAQLTPASCESFGFFLKTRTSVHRHFYDSVIRRASASSGP